MKRVPSLLWRGRDETCCYLLAHYFVIQNILKTNYFIHTYRELYPNFSILFLIFVIKCHLAYHMGSYQINIWERLLSLKITQFF